MIRIENSKIYGSVYIPVDGNDVMRDSRLYPYKNFGLYGSTIESIDGLDVIECRYLQKSDYVYEFGIRRSVEFYSGGEFRDIRIGERVLMNSQYEDILVYESIGYSGDCVTVNNISNYLVGDLVFDGMNEYTIISIIGNDLYLDRDYIGSGNLGNYYGDDYVRTVYQNGVFIFDGNDLQYDGNYELVYIYLENGMNEAYMLNRDLNGDYLSGIDVSYRLSKPILLKCDFSYSLSVESDLVLSCPAELSVAHPVGGMYDVEDATFKILNFSGMYERTYNSVIIPVGSFMISGLYLSSYGLDMFDFAPSYSYRDGGFEQLTQNCVFQNISDYTRIFLNLVGYNFITGDIILVGGDMVCIIGVGSNYIDVKKQLYLVDGIYTIENLNTYGTSIESEIYILNKTIGRIYEIVEESGNIKFNGGVGKYRREDLTCVIDGNNMSLTNYMNEQSIFGYLTNYLDVDSNLSIPLNSMQLTYNNIEGDINRVGVEGSDKLVGKGTVIILGSGISLTFGSGIFVQLDIDGTLYEDIWVDEIINRDGVNYLYTNNYFPTPTSTININPYTLVQDCLDKLDMYYDISTFKMPEHIDLSTYVKLFLGELSSGGYDIFDTISVVLFNGKNAMNVYINKLDKNSRYDIDRLDVACATINDIDLLTNSIDGYVLQNGDFVIVKNQNDINENGLYVYENGLVRDNVKQLTYYHILNGDININKYFVYTDVFMEVNNRTFIDDRLSLKFREYAELTIDGFNEFKPIDRADILVNGLYDIKIGENINLSNNIRFIDGLTEEKIKKNLEGQGQYSWILNEQNIIENAIVGCTQEFGPGTGDLIWYTGNWLNGTFCGGIWISGVWENGIWLTGQFYSKNINDFTFYVLYSDTNNLVSSIWKDGVFVDGEMYGGTVENITWMNGKFYWGVINDGIWKNGEFYSGVINHIFWQSGHFYGGDFETGVWITGTFDGGRFGINSQSTIEYKDRAIWVSGEFNGGGFYSDDNKSAVFYNGVFRGIFYGGSFVFGEVDNAVFYDGVYFGGIYSNIVVIDDNTFKLNIDFHMYDDIIGLDVLNGYTTFNDIYIGITDELYLKADVIIPNTTSNELFINEWYSNHNMNYNVLDIVSIDNVNNEIVLNGTDINLLNSTTYYQNDANTNTPNGNPFLMYKFVGDFNGVWLNGYFELGSFSGAWINGFAKTIVYN